MRFYEFERSNIISDEAYTKFRAEHLGALPEACEKGVGAVFSWLVEYRQALLQYKKECRDEDAYHIKLTIQNAGLGIELVDVLKTDKSNPHNMAASAVSRILAILSFSGLSLNDGLIENPIDEWYSDYKEKLNEAEKLSETFGNVPEP